MIVFEFFTEVFNIWPKSGWKCFLTSFDDGAFNRLFTAKKERMLAIERRMERHVNLDFRHRTTECLEMPALATSMIEGTTEGCSDAVVGDGTGPPSSELDALPSPQAPYRYNRAEIQAELANFTTQWKDQIEVLIERFTIACKPGFEI
ncbi:hypothetical protein FAGAP_5038 [Fusarium agapanthi]|uniref:Uncharacterized protein n=1 Tax=Fusarium agapanthi TaxID=1803897 RepID=A0A9P5EDF4_9HYPO|nr:hypothetical protein FAGAP_5038 [Fusarium agapanthi]